MKKILFAASSILALAACKEKAPYINFAELQSVDTTYVISPVPATDPHNVLVEEFTGQMCSNCPAAHDQLKAISNGSPGRVNIVGLYMYGSPQTRKPEGAANDFRDSASNFINTTYYASISDLPSGGVDRVPQAGRISLYKNAWADAIATRLGATDSLNLAVKSVYDSTTGIAQIKVTVTYTKDVATPENLTVVIVESDIIDKQEFPTELREEYDFTNVFRTMLTTVPSGDPLTVGSSHDKKAGRVFERVFTYKPADFKSSEPRLKPRNCKVIAYVNTQNGTDYHISQSTSAPLVE